MSLTIAQLAEHLQLDADYLRELGLTDRPQYGGSVRIPYADIHGQETGARFMSKTEGIGRLNWPPNAQVTLYGLDRIAETTDIDQVALVNGEEDCWPLWFDNYQAVGLPGVNAWVEERDAQHLARFGRIYIAVQAGPPFETVIDWLGRSQIKDRAYLIPLPAEAPSLATIWRHDPAGFEDHWQGLIARATAYNDRAQQDRINFRNQSRVRGGRLLRSDNILEEVYRTAKSSSVLSAKSA